MTNRQYGECTVILYEIISYIQHNNKVFVCLFVLTENKSYKILKLLSSTESNNKLFITRNSKLFVTTCNPSTFQHGLILQNTFSISILF